MWDVRLAQLPPLTAPPAEASPECSTPTLSRALYRQCVVGWTPMHVVVAPGALAMWREGAALDTAGRELRLAREALHVRLRWSWPTCSTRGL